MKISGYNELEKEAHYTADSLLALYINQRLPFLLIVHLAAQQAEIHEREHAYAGQQDYARRARATLLSQNTVL